MRRQGISETTIRQKAKWYDDRARGHRERIERVEACESQIVNVSCPCCGVAREFSAGCRSWMLCSRCRRATAAQLRARFLAARGQVVDSARARGLLNPARRGGRWGERFLTLTLPHAVPSISGRIDLAFRAWTAFLKRFNAHWLDVDAPSVESLRVFEWTPGSDGRGHPHFHIWIFSPFLDVQLVREWWRRALENAGAVVGEHLIVDIRAVDDPSDAAKELIKYMLKDIAADGGKIDAEIFSMVYEALGGRRMRQASSGFMGRANKVKPCCECGTVLPRVVRVARKPKDSIE
jgi:hypothetical protein